MAFPFASWEYPQWHPAWLAHMSVQTEHHLLQLSVREPVWNATRYLGRQSHWLFFRALGSREQGNFALNHPISFPFCEPSPAVREFGDLSSRQMEVEVEEALQEGSFARVFFLNEEKQLRCFDEIASYRVIVSGRGWGEWRRLEIEREPGLRYGSGGIPRFCQSAVFRWAHEPDINRFLSTSAPEMWAHIQEQSSDLALECGIARRMLDLPAMEAYELVRRWNRKQHAELYQVLRAAFLSLDELWEDSKSYEWVVKLDKISAPWHRGELHPIPGRYAGHFVDAPDVLRRVLRRVSSYFNVAATPKYRAPHLELALTQERTQNPLGIRIEKPTFEERQAAKKFWNEWQKAHPAVS